MICRICNKQFNLHQVPKGYTMEIVGGKGICPECSAGKNPMVTGTIATEPIQAIAPRESLNLVPIVATTPEEPEPEEPEGIDF